MAELLIPLNRTMFLPPGSPGVGAIVKVSGDLRDVRCGGSGGEVYCLGEADILIDYLSWQADGLFASGLPIDQNGGRQEWQALLTLAFQVNAAGELPDEYRVELAPINYSQVAARAVELETALVLSWEDAVSPPPHPADAAVVDAAVAAAPELPREPSPAFVQRPRFAAATPDQPTKSTKGGAWTMVSLPNETEQEQKMTLSPEPGPLRPVQVIGLSDDAREEDIRATIVRALEEAEAVAAACRESWADAPPPLAEDEDTYTISAVFPALADDIPSEDILPETPELAPAAPELAPGETDDAADIIIEEDEEFEQNAAPAPTAEDALLLDEEESAAEDIEAELEAPAPAISLTVKDVPLARVAPLIAPPTQHAAAIADAAPAVVELEPEQIEDSFVAEEAEQTAIAADIALPAEEATPRKRRFSGWPGLYVEAHNNDIDLTAFKINIKL